MKTVVISLGGSEIIPENVNSKYLKEFKKIILRNLKNYKIVVVCGGGSLARKYIHAIESVGGNIYHQSLAGINATRANARFLSYFFGFDPEWGIPHKIRILKKYLRKRNLVICGGLEYKSNQTSDSTAATIAFKLNAQFINLTNVKGLYDKDPKKFKNAKFVPKISWENFDKIVKKIKFKPGQHFVLDQEASKIIMKNKIQTYIMMNLKELETFFHGKNFIGTTIGE
ncbi:UMP kinase [Candidatus Pacearchaeota archaeon CG_4_10_14_0_2_um_filter_30_11]|nr:MAG: UMP kinase [Candidatus Pacearchaeota archaeon CG_4_10_14_0_2_um_filter_30_11]